MTVIVDTGVLYADHDTDATRHDAAASALKTVYDGEFGQPYVSDYIYDEGFTLTRTPVKNVSPATALGRRIRGADPFPVVYDLLRVSAAVFTCAVELFEQYDDQALSFTDATTIALLRHHDIDAALSFDDDFDGYAGDEETAVTDDHGAWGVDSD